MDAKLINAFLTAGMDAFESMFQITTQIKEPYILDINAGHPWEVSGIIGATGFHKGIVAFRLHKVLASKMLEVSGIECKPDEREEMACELVSEFTNIISGNAISKIPDYELEISPPLTVSGPNHQIMWPKNFPVIAIPFSTKYGSFEVDVCFK